MRPRTEAADPSWRSRELRTSFRTLCEEHMPRAPREAGKGQIPFAFQLLGWGLGSQPACPETPFTLIQNLKNASFAHQISISPFKVWEPPPRLFGVLEGRNVASHSKSYNCWTLAFAASLAARTWAREIRSICHVSPTRHRIQGWPDQDTGTVLCMGGRSDGDSDGYGVLSRAANCRVWCWAVVEGPPPASPASPAVLGLSFNACLWLAFAGLPLRSSGRCRMEVRKLG